MTKNWVSGAIKHPGALHKQLGVPQGQKIPAKKLEKAASAGGVEGKRARLAETLNSMKHTPGKHTDVRSDRGMFKHRTHKP